MDIDSYKRSKKYADDKSVLHISNWSNNKQGAMKTNFEFPAFIKHDGNPIISGNSSTGDQAGFSSPLRVKDILLNPIDDYYMYWAGHDGGGIWLSTAPHPLGPWTEWGMVFDVDSMGGGFHVSSPDVIYVPELDVIRMYYHRAYDSSEKGYIQETEYAETSTTGNGTSWTTEGTLIDCPMNNYFDEQESSYARVLRHNGDFLFVYQGRDRENNAPGIGFVVSRDGKNVTYRSKIPLFYNSQFTEDYSPDGFVGGSPNIIFLGDTLWLFYADGDSDRIIKATPIDNPYEKNPSQTTVLEATSDWEISNNGLESPSFLVDDGFLYLYYNSVAGTIRKIGVAYTDLRGLL